MIKITIIYCYIIIKSNTILLVMGYNLKTLALHLKQQDISNRTFFITGGNSGFGYLVSKTILESGGTVIIGCRSEERALEACKQLKEESGSDRVSYLLIDMTKPDSINNCISEIKEQNLHINVLVNNAGVSMVSHYTQTSTGIELTCQTNYIGVVQLTEGLTSLLEQEESPRVIFVSSLTYTKGRVTQLDKYHLEVDKEHYERFHSYYRSKYLITSYAMHYANQHPKVYVTACDPGVAATNIARELGCIGKLYAMSFFQLFAPSWKGACTIAYAAASDEIKTIMKSGEMCKNCRRKEMIKAVQNRSEQSTIFTLTQEILNDIAKNGKIN